MLMTYPAIFKEEEQGGFYIQFPDVEGNGTQGETILDGIKMAEDYLEIMLNDYKEQQEEYPQSTSIEELEEKYPREIIKFISVETD
jgi:antitoxin HicB